VIALDRAKDAAAQRELSELASRLEIATSARVEAERTYDRDQGDVAPLTAAQAKEASARRSHETATRTANEAHAQLGATEKRLVEARAALAKAKDAAALHARADLQPFRANAKPLCDRILTNLRAIFADANALDAMLADANDAAKRLRTEHAETVSDLDTRHRVMPLIETLVREKPGIEAAIIRFWPTILESIATPLPRVFVGDFFRWVSGDLKPGPVSDDTRARFAALSTARGPNFAAELDAAQAKTKAEETCRAQAAIREFEDDQARARESRNAMTISRVESDRRIEP
jgi:hypothetical protein